MSKPRRFPVKVEFFTTEEHEAAFNALAASGLLTKSDFYRLAFDTFLRRQGAMTPKPMPNGHAQHAALA